MKDVVKASAIEPISPDVTVAIPLCAINEFYMLLDRASNVQALIEDAATPMPRVVHRSLSTRYRVAAANLAMVYREATGEMPDQLD